MGIYTVPQHHKDGTSCWQLSLWSQANGYNMCYLPLGGKGVCLPCCMERSGPAGSFSFSFLSSFFLFLSSFFSLLSCRDKEQSPHETTRAWRMDRTMCVMHVSMLTTDLQRHECCCKVSKSIRNTPKQFHNNTFCIVSNFLKSPHFKTHIIINFYKNSNCSVQKCIKTMCTAVKLNVIFHTGNGWHFFPIRIKVLARALSFHTEDSLRDNVTWDNVHHAEDNLESTDLVFGVIMFRADMEKVLHFENVACACGQHGNVSHI